MQINKSGNYSEYRSDTKYNIDMLLSSGAVNLSEPTIQLTTCSPNVDVVINGQGGICTSCNLLFLSRSSLVNHLEKCSPGNNIFSKENKSDYIDNDNDYIDNNDCASDQMLSNLQENKKHKGPRLNIKKI